MGNIGVFELIMLAFIVAMLYLWYRELNRRKYLGDLILRLPRNFANKASIVFWCIMLAFWVFFLIEATISFNNDFAIAGYRRLIAPLLWMFICPLNIIRDINYQEIRQQGIKLPEGIIYWKDVIDYNWIQESTLKISFYNSIPSLRKFERSIQLKIDSEQQPRIDALLKSNDVIIKGK